IEAFKMREQQAKRYDRMLLNNWYDEDHYYYLDSAPAQILYRAVANILQNLGCKSILDVGCHHGNLVPYLKRHALQRYVGIDLCDRAIETARKRYQGDCKIDFLNDDWHSLAMVRNYGKFDGIYFGGVLFYIQEPKCAFLSEFLRATEAEIFAIQELANTDLSSIRNQFHCLSEKYFYLDFEFPRKSWGPEWRKEFDWNEHWDSTVLKERQLLTFSASQVDQ
ncbi:MAG: class I SAM-dependent methyltransferase, partial [Candidatus Binatia bacterium]